MMKVVPRRLARKIIASAIRVVNQYQSIEPRHTQPIETTEVVVTDFIKLFNEHPSWKLKEGTGAYYVHVPNQYAYENYVVFP